MHVALYIYICVSIRRDDGGPRTCAVGLGTGGSWERQPLNRGNQSRQTPFPSLPSRLLRRAPTHSTHGARCASHRGHQTRRHAAMLRSRSRAWGAQTEVGSHPSLSPRARDGAAAGAGQLTLRAVLAFPCYCCCCCCRCRRDRWGVSAPVDTRKATSPEVPLHPPPVSAPGQSQTLAAVSLHL